MRGAAQVRKGEGRPYHDPSFNSPRIVQRRKTTEVALDGDVLARHYARAGMRTSFTASRKRSSSSLICM